MSELKNCPFCGGEADVVKTKRFGRRVACWDCDVATDEYDTDYIGGAYDKAIAAWNCRTDNWIDGTPPKLGDTDQLIVIEYPAPISKSPLYAVLRWRDGNYSDARYQVAKRWMLLPKGAE